MGYSLGKSVFLHNAYGWSLVLIFDHSELESVLYLSLLSNTNIERLHKNNKTRFVFNKWRYTDWIPFHNNQGVDNYPN
jgi:hypothetical protein